jgi:predicted Zn-dependent protease
MIQFTENKTSRLALIAKDNGFSKKAASPRKNRLYFELIFAAILFLACSRPAPAQQEHHHAGGASEQLGAISFPTSCSPGVELPFERGVALLHSFWYEESAKQFEAVAVHDPHCAMAYWGEAMSYWHPLWERPSAEALQQGWAAIEKANGIGAKTQRERDYIAAIGAFYRDSAKREHLARATAYAEAMEKLSAQYPDDREAAIFYALALLGSRPPDDTTFVNNRKAAVILEKIFAAQPDHPGVAHYLIHAYDNPELAPLGLNAARRYAQIAPSSPHALHMPSHIFTRLGLWQDSIASNLASVAATRKSYEMHMGGASHQLHAMDYLVYAYLQCGQEADARRINEGLHSIPGMSADDLSYPLTEFPARYALELHHWSDAAALEIPKGVSLGDRATIFWARAIGAARSGDAAAARRDVEQLEALKSPPGQHRYSTRESEIRLEEARAWLAFAEGKGEDAARLLRAAADREDVARFELAIPAREMLGELLLELKQPTPALAEFENSLRLSPNRFNALYGAGRAAELAGNSEKAASYYALLLKNCDGGAHSDRPELSRAKTLVARAGLGFDCIPSAARVLHLGLSAHGRIEPAQTARMVSYGWQGGGMSIRLRLIAAIAALAISLLCSRQPANLAAPVICGLTKQPATMFDAAQIPGLFVLPQTPKDLPPGITRDPSSGYRLEQGRQLQ